MCELSLYLSTAKRIFMKGGATNTWRTHLVKFHNKAELLFLCQGCILNQMNSSIHRDRLHKLLINGIAIGGRCLAILREADRSQFLECTASGKACDDVSPISMSDILPTTLLTRRM
jgi:hypothetical protein